MPFKPVETALIDKPSTSAISFIVTVERLPAMFPSDKLKICFIVEAIYNIDSFFEKTRVKKEKILKFSPACQYNTMNFRQKKEKREGSL